MTSCLRFHHTAALLGVVVIMSMSPSFSSAAPLCSQVLRIYSQEQIDASIDAFTRLTIQADEAKALGQSNALARSIRSSQRAKENELIQTLNISRDALRKLVSARSAILQKGNNADKESDTSARKRTTSKESKIIKAFVLDKHLEPKNISGVWSFELVANGTKLLAHGSNKALISLEEGSTKDLFGQGELITPDAMYTSERTMQGTVDLSITNLHNGTQTKLPGFDQPSSKMASFDKQSIVETKTMMGEHFEYQQVDKQGRLLSQGSIPELKDSQLSHIGTHIWVAQLPNASYVLFNPITRDIKPLGVVGSTLWSLGENRVAIQNATTLYNVDLTTGQHFAKDLGAEFGVSFANEKFIWITKEVSQNSRALIKIDIKTLEEVPDFYFPFEAVLSANANHAANLLAINSADYNLQSTRAIYRIDNPKVPVFKTSEIYDEKNVIIRAQLLSDDGQSVIIVGSTGSKDGLFVDVWKLK